MDEKRLGASFCPSRGQIRWFLTVLVAFAALVRLMVAYITVHYFDLSFYVDWSTGVANDFFGAYNNIGNLDYPPLFLFPLFLTGKLLGIGAVRAFDPYMMLALKGWQVLFDLACIPLLYRVLRREGQLVGLAGAAIWAVNPAGILNSSYWGQTDSIMIFLVVLAFLLLEEGRPVWSGVVMALACLMKFQSLYFAPVYAVALLTSYPPRRIFQTVAAGAGTVLAVFLPFMARSGWALPLEIYFGGFGQYQGASLNAFNFYSSAGLNYKHFSTKILGLIQADHLSTLLLAAALALLVAVWFTATEKSVWLMGFLFMQTVFMFTTRMHERYQIPVLVMALIAAARHRSRGMFASFEALAVMVFLNQFLVLQQIFAADKQAGWIAHYDTVVVALSHVNLLLYFATAWVALRVCYRRGHYGFARSFRAMLPERWRGSPPGPNPQRGAP